MPLSRGGSDVPAYLATIKIPIISIARLKMVRVKNLI